MLDATLALSALYARGIDSEADFQRALMWLDAVLRAGLTIDPALGSFLIPRLAPSQVRAAWDAARQHYDRIRLVAGPNAATDPATDAAADPATDPGPVPDGLGAEP